MQDITRPYVQITDSAPALQCCRAHAKINRKMRNSTPCNPGKSSIMPVGQNARLFAPGPFRSRERKFYGWNFHSLELSLRGTFVPWNVRSVELSSPRTFVPKHESSIELSFCGTFVPGTFVSPVRSSAAVSTVGNVIFGYCMNSATSSTNIYFVLFVQILVYEQ